jgi:hypothetical protein
MDSESAAVPNQQAKSPSSPTKNTAMNGTSQAPSGFRHHLPQIPTMNRNPKIAQSKASAKKEVANPPAVANPVLVVEDAGKVVTMDADLKEEISIQKLPEGLFNLEVTDVNVVLFQVIQEIQNKLSFKITTNNSKPHLSSHTTTNNIASLTYLHISISMRFNLTAHDHPSYSNTHHSSPRV